jgi:hypothetical protein
MDAQEIATLALNLQIQLNAVTAELEAQKELLRQLANNKVLHLTVENLGKIDVTAPRVGTQKIELEINEEKLQKVPALRQALIAKGVAKEVLAVDKDKLIDAPELKQKLIDKGIITEQTKMVSAAKASVRIQPNV